MHPSVGRPSLLRSFLIYCTRCISTRARLHTGCVTRTQAPEITLAAVDEVTRQRCVRIIQAASAKGISPSLHSIASSVALTSDMFSMKSAAAVAAVLAALRLTMNDPSLEIHFLLFKHFQFDPAELKAVGFDAATLKAAGFAAAQIMLLYGLDLAGLLRLRYDAEALNAIGVSTAELINGCYPEKTEVSMHHARARATAAQAPTRCRICFIEDDLSSILMRPQRVGSYVYATLHAHDVNDGTVVYDGSKRVEVPSGWVIAPNEPDVRQICAQYKWQSTALVLDDGSVNCTAGNAGGRSWF